MLFIPMSVIGHKWIAKKHKSTKGTNQKVFDTAVLLLCLLFFCAFLWPYLQLLLKRFALHWSQISLGLGFSVVDS